MGDGDGDLGDGPAVPQLAAAALILADARPGLAAGYLAGLLLVAWIAVQLLILRRYSFLQPVIAGIGAAEVLLAWRWQRGAAAGPGGSSPGCGTNASSWTCRSSARWRRWSSASSPTIHPTSISGRRIPDLEAGYEP